MTIGNNMILISSSWREMPTFKMMPVSKECPYSEVVFDPTSGVLVVIGNLFKPSLHMLTKLDDNGDPMKSAKPRKNGSMFKEERRTVETFIEYYIANRQEQKDFVSMFAVNAQSFNTEDYYKASDTIIELSKSPTQPEDEATTQENKLEAAVQS